MAQDPKDILKHCLPSYEVLEQLGRGSFGTVFKVKDSLKERAVKIVPLLVERSLDFRNSSALDSKLSQDFRAVQEYYDSIKGPGVLEVHDFHLVDKEISEREARAWLVVLMEYCPDNLTDHVLDNYPLPPEAAAEFMRQLASTLDRLSTGDAAFLVTDLKPSNILIDRFGRLLIGDLGGIKKLSSVSSTVQSQFTLDWSAPEVVIKGQRPTVRSVIFACGLVSYFIIEGRLPYPDLNFVERLHSLRDNGVPYARQDIPPHIGSMLSRCLASEPEDRWQDFAEVVAALHPSNLEQPAPEPLQQTTPQDAPPPRPEQEDLSILDQSTLVPIHLPEQQARQAESLVLQANAALIEENWPQAQELLLKALEEQPEHVEARKLLAKAEKGLLAADITERKALAQKAQAAGVQKLARERWEEVLRLAPEDSEALNALRQLKEAELAEQEQESAVIEPETAAAPRDTAPPPRPARKSPLRWAVPLVVLLGVLLLVVDFGKWQSSTPPESDVQGPTELEPVQGPEPEPEPARPPELEPPREEQPVTREEMLRSELEAMRREVAPEKTAENLEQSNASSRHFNVIGVEVDDVLNIREKARQMSNKVGEIPFDGKCIVGVADPSQDRFYAGNRWKRIQYGQYTGWVNTRYLEGTSDCQGEPKSPPTDFKTWTDPTTGMEFVWVPGGSFEMGCGPWQSDCYDNEKPVHRVTLKGFWLGKFEVTQAQWQKVMGDNPSRFKKDGDYPVERVSWDDVQQFIKALNAKGSAKFRLPSEAQWEYACRSGGKAERYSGGSDVGRVAWYSGNSQDSTHPVGRKDPNGLGLHDMSGNVWEWVEDRWHDNYNGAPTDGSAWVSGDAFLRVSRGGRWGSGARDVRCAVRGRFFPDIRYDSQGFRLLRTD